MLVINMRAQRAYAVGGEDVVGHNLCLSEDDVIVGFRWAHLMPWNN